MGQVPPMIVLQSRLNARNPCTNPMLLPERSPAPDTYGASSLGESEAVGPHGTGAAREAAQGDPAAKPGGEEPIRFHPDTGGAPHPIQLFVESPLGSPASHRPEVRGRAARGCPPGESE